MDPKSVRGYSAICRSRPEGDILSSARNQSPDLVASDCSETRSAPAFGDLEGQKARQSAKIPRDSAERLL
jgi:hypothetical protein